VTILSNRKQLLIKNLPVGFARHQVGAGETTAITTIGAPPGSMLI